MNESERGLDPIEERQGIHHGFIDPVSACTSSKDKDCKSSGLLPICRAEEKLLPDGVPGDDRFISREILLRFLKGDKDALAEPSQDAIGHPGNHVLLMDGSLDSKPRSSKKCRSGG